MPVNEQQAGPQGKLLPAGMELCLQFADEKIPLLDGNHGQDVLHYMLEGVGEQFKRLY